jgi:predicted nucleic acid-binding protein
MTRLCLDTSAYSHFMRNDQQAVELIRRARDVAVPAVVLGELRTGFRRGAREDENERYLQRFLANSAVRVLSVDDETSTCYADIMSDLLARGIPVPTNDVWIAAVAARDGYTVVTYDEHFLQISRVAANVLRSLS